MCCLVFTFSGFETRSGFKRELDINEANELFFIIFGYPKQNCQVHIQYTPLVHRRPTRQPAAIA